MKSPKTLEDNYTEYHANIKSGDEIVESNWCYDYDLWDYSGPWPINMSVREEWVGKKAKDCCIAWEYFRKPIENYSI
jgi:hypothetical protein